MSENAKHTPTWIRFELFIEDSEGNSVASFRDEDEAEQCVREHNAHDELVAALRDMLETSNDAERYIGITAPEHAYEGLMGNLLSAQARARAALAKVGK